MLAFVSDPDSPHMAWHRACGNAVAAELAQAVVGDSAGLVGKVWGW